MSQCVSSQATKQPGESIGIFGHFCWVDSFSKSKFSIQTWDANGLSARCDDADEDPERKNWMTNVVKRNKPSPVAQSLAFEVFKDIQSIRI